MRRRPDVTTWRGQRTLPDGTHECATCTPTAYPPRPQNVILCGRCGVVLELGPNETTTLDKDDTLCWVCDAIVDLSVAMPDREARLMQLAALKDGWCDEPAFGQAGSKRPTAEAIGAAARWILEHDWRGKMNGPRIYPTPDGGVQVEGPGFEIEAQPDGTLDELFVHDRARPPTRATRDDERGDAEERTTPC